MSLIRHPILQYAYVVDDLDAAMARWTEMFGAGPFLHIPHCKVPNHRYRGQPTHDDVSHAQGQAGAVQIQLTQQHDDAPSIWRDMYPDGGQGLHHVMIMVDDFDGEKARFEGYSCVAAEEFDIPLAEGPDAPVARFAYMDARHLIGCFVEIVEENAVVRHEVVELKRLHDAWDGKTDPVRATI